MVVYNTYLDKENRSHKILHADMTDENGMMTVTLIFPAHLIERHEKNILPGSGISITNFKILPKSNYDRGDCDHIISLDESSVVETLSPICKEYNFIPDTTIKQFAKIQTCTQLEPLELPSPLPTKGYPYSLVRWHFHLSETKEVSPKAQPRQKN
jgi:hypothetical protein